MFGNDFAALLPDTPSGSVHDETGLLQAESVRGECRVICFSPRHDVTIAEMTVQEVRYVVDAWCEQYREMGALAHVNYVQVFENKGAAMGCSNPHPHGQVWASDFIPMEVQLELDNMERYTREHPDKNMLRVYAALEESRRERIVCDNRSFLAVVPFWATWPFETLVLPRSSLHLKSLTDFSEDQKVCKDVVFQHARTTKH